MRLNTFDIKLLQDTVARESGNVITARQANMLEQQLAPLAVSEGLDTLERLVAALRSGQSRELGKKVAEAVTVNETSFFRDGHPFHTLRAKILPELIERNAIERKIRIWSAACSSGQEPYSIAMIVREHFPVLYNWDVSILATDISEKVLEKTRSGLYRPLEINRGLPAGTRTRFFDQAGPDWRAKPELRELIKCRRLNLTNGWPGMGQFDVIFIRNVLIYFDQATKAEILRRVCSLLSPEGYLILGSTEMIAGLDLPLKRESIDDSICYRPNN